MGGVVDTVADAAGSVLEPVKDAWNDLTGKTQAKNARKAAQANARSMRHAAKIQADAMRHQTDVAERIAQRQMDIGEEQLDIARESVEARQDIADRQLALGERQQEFAEGRWDQYQERFGPVEQALATYAMEQAEPDYGQFTSQAAADVATQYGSAFDQYGRNLQRYGMNPNSGKFAEMSTQRNLQKAADTAQAMTDARRDAESRSFNVMQGALGRGSYLPSMAQRGLAQAGQTYGGAAGTQAGLTGAFQGASGMYGQATGAIGQAGQLAQGAGSGFYKAGNLTNQIYGQASDNWQYQQNYVTDQIGKIAKAFGMGFAEGGEVDSDEMMEEGRAIQGPGTGQSDSIPAQIETDGGGAIPARLSDGEYVVPAEAVQYIGLEKLDKMVEKAQQAMEGR